MRKEIIVIILASLLLYGCGTIGGSRKASDSPVFQEYRKGTNGIILKFVKDLPPEKVFMNQNFDLGIEIRNVGATDVDQGYLHVINLENDYMKMETEWNPTEELAMQSILEGKKSSSPDGGYQFITFPVENVGIPEIEDSHKFTFKARVCYKYRTAGTATMCINPGMYKFLNFLTSVCRVEDVKLSGGQGAPIAITKVSERMIPRDDSTMELQFIIDIQNAADGLVTSAQGDVFGNECNNRPAPNVGLDQIEQTDIRVFLSGQQIECEKPAVDAQDSNKGTIICKTQIDSNQGSYTAPLVVQFDYGYVSKDYESSVTVDRMLLDVYCPAERCKEKDKFGTCSVFGGEDRSMECEDSTMMCCKYSEPDCDRLPEYEEYSCGDEKCNTEDLLVNRCPEGQYCCKSGSTSNCPSNNCMDTETECRNGFGGVDYDGTCPGNQVCCKYEALESPDATHCGVKEDTAGYECVANPSALYTCKSFLCRNPNEKCCKEGTLCPSGNCLASESACRAGYGGKNDNPEVKCPDSKFPVCCVLPVPGVGENPSYCDRLNTDESLRQQLGVTTLADHRWACVQITTWSETDINSKCTDYLCPGSSKCCQISTTT